MSKRPRIWIVAGVVLTAIGLIDPLEGSLAILPGTALIMLGAILGKSRWRKLLLWAFVLTAGGIGIMVVMSAFGGIGGDTGRSMWWALVVLPYPVGCVMSLVGGIRSLRELSKARGVSAVAVLLLTLAAGPAKAEIVGCSASGFLVRSEAHVGARPDSVYRALVGHVGGWWDPAHTFSGDARNLSLDPTPGGCFCERLPNGGGVRHLEVVFAAPGETLRMSGALGPLQGEALTGSMTWSLQGADDSTAVELTYSVGGYYSGDIQTIASAVDAVLHEQLVRLKTYVEKGAVDSRSERP